MELIVGIDLQLQIFIFAAVFGFIFFLIICFLAGICGQISKIKRIQCKLIQDTSTPMTGYDNYAYNSRNIQPDEELSRRGYTMYDPYVQRNQTSNVHQNSNNNNTLNRLSKTQELVQQNNLVEVTVVGEESRDAASEYSIANAETVVMTGNDVEMKIKTSYPPEFRGIPPPPAFVNRFDVEQNTSTAEKLEEQK